MTLYPDHVFPSEELLDCQSGTEKFNISVATGSKDLSSQNVQFTDQNPAYSYVVDSEYDPTRSSVDSNDATLEQFFSRPLKIAQYTWSVSLPNFIETFNPWELYWENPRVINRISNFNLLRAKMHVKIVINGNGFHYGRLIASYTPLHTVDDFTITRGFFTQDIIQASQRPHIYLDPTTSQGGSMCLPFFWHRNSLNIPRQDWGEMGEITISSLAPLKHANGADDRVTISVFAWAEDVNMSMPTSSEPTDLSPQCAEEPLDCQAADEYAKDGVVSAPASTVARIAGKLSSAPIIGPYAKATEMAASTVAGVARIFGYSRPAVLADIMPYKPTVMGNLANTNAADSVMKLSLDAKQELSIDPRITGLSGVDELSIKSIACRESYLTQFPWSVASTAETALFSTEVSPVVWDILALGGDPEEIHMPACCFAAAPFTHWRGSMKYRFQVVASNFHKGRLKVVWDPYGFETNEYNTNYTHIVDIAEDKDFTIEIGWGSELSYLTHREPGLDAVIFKNGAPTSTPENLSNGLLAVYVVNELTVPNSTIDNDITVNVFVSAGDDFEVNNPDADLISNFTWFPPLQPPALRERFEQEVQRQKDRGFLPPQTTFSDGVQELGLTPSSNGVIQGPQPNDRVQLDPQSAEESIPQSDKENTTEPSAPMQTQVAGSMGAKQDDGDQMLHVHYGEAVQSFRQCLKRYNLHACTGIGSSGSTWYHRTQNNLPYHKGRAPGSIHGSHNYAKMTLLNYLLPAYTGYRGASRWKYQLFGGDANFSSYMSVTRMPFNTNGNGYEEVAFAGFQIDTPAAMNYEGILRLPDSWPGSCATATRANPVIEAELPYVSNLRFGFAKEANLTTSGFNNYYHRLDICCADNSDGTSSPTAARVACFNSVGEDFNLYFFTGCPVAYREAVVPPPPP